MDTDSLQVLFGDRMAIKFKQKICEHIFQDSSFKADNIKILVVWLPPIILYCV
jgi:hypothetical protein